MQSFTKIIFPGTMPYDGPGAINRMAVYCKVEYKAPAPDSDKPGKLSITGVEGPLNNGDARGSCGQIYMHLSAPGGLDGFEPNESQGWTVEGFKHFLSIWESYHLNDMRAYTPAMRDAGWHERAKLAMRGYEFTRDLPAIEASNAAKKRALDALKAGETFTPSKAESAAYAAPYSVKIWCYADDPAPDCPAGYKPGKIENKTLGWLSPSEHDDGLLGRKLDGKGYGSSWYSESVPLDVLTRLAFLPDTNRNPAWV